MSHAVSTASPALHKPKRTALQRFRSPERFATMVAAIVPTTTGHRARDPRAISTPADTPAAGQKTATPSGLVSRARLSLAARKYEMPTATASPTEPSHCLRPMPGDSSSCRTWLCRFSDTSVLPPHINQRAVLLG